MRLADFFNSEARNRRVKHLHNMINYLDFVIHDTKLKVKYRHAPEVCAVMHPFMGRVLFFLIEIHWMSIHGLKLKVPIRTLSMSQNEMAPFGSLTVTNSLNDTVLSFNEYSDNKEVTDSLYHTLYPEVKYNRFYYLMNKEGYREVDNDRLVSDS